MNDTTKELELLEAIAEYGEEFCALECIESVEELKSRSDELLKYVAGRKLGEKSGQEVIGDGTTADRRDVYDEGRAGKA